MGRKGHSSTRALLEPGHVEGGLLYCAIELDGLQSSCEGAGVVTHRGQQLGVLLVVEAPQPHVPVCPYQDVFPLHMWKTYGKYMAGKA